MTFSTGLGVGVIAVMVGLSGVFGCGSGTNTGDGGTPGSAGTTGSGGSTGAGGAGGAPASSGVDGNKRLDALTTAEVMTICDFAAQILGGYGHVMNCPDGSTIEAEASQASCVAGRPTTCAATVSEYEACVRGISCTTLIPASCLPFLQCS